MTVTAAVYGGITAQSMLLVTPPGVTAQPVDVAVGGAAIADLTATGAGGTGEVEVAEYSGNPGGPATFAAAGTDFHVSLSAGSTFTSLRLVRCGLRADQRLYWWNGTAWAAVQPASSSFAAAGGCLTFTLTAASAPSLTDLSGTAFAVANPAAVVVPGSGSVTASPAPVVSGISPAGGPAAGGTAVTITGTNLAAATAVAFGGVAASSFTVDSATEITAISPPGSGTVEVTVTTPDGYSLTGSGDRFTYAVAAAQAVPVAPQFRDVPSTYWAYAAIQALAGAGVASGYPDGTFRPDAAVTRAEFTKMLVLSLGDRPAADGASPFRDVAPSSWYAPYVAAAVRAGLVDGISATRFEPDAALTREQMAVLVARALKPTFRG